MALYIDGIEMDSVRIDGTELDTLSIDGTEVFTAFAETNTMNIAGGGGTGDYGYRYYGYADSGWLGTVTPAYAPLSGDFIERIFIYDQNNGYFSFYWTTTEKTYTYAKITLPSGTQITGQQGAPIAVSYSVYLEFKNAVGSPLPIIIEEYT